MSTLVSILWFLIVLCAHTFICCLTAFVWDVLYAMRGQSDDTPVVLMPFACLMAFVITCLVFAAGWA